MRATPAGVPTSGGVRGPVERIGSRERGGLSFPDVRPLSCNGQTGLRKCSVAVWAGRTSSPLRSFSAATCSVGRLTRRPPSPCRPVPRGGRQRHRHRGRLPDLGTGNHGGESDTIIGEWMKARGNRSRVKVVTKVGSPTAVLLAIPSVARPRKDPVYARMVSSGASAQAKIVGISETKRPAGEIMQGGRFRSGGDMAWDGYRCFSLSD